MLKIKEFLAKYKSYIFLFIIILLALKVFIPELDSLKESFNAVKNADIGLIVFGQIIFFLGLPVLAWQFMVIAIKPIKYNLTYRVQMASLFVSRLFPSSLGSFALNFYYLVQKKHTTIEASSVMAINAITSSIAYVFIIGFSLLFSNGAVISTSTESTLNWNILVAILVILVIAGIALLCFKTIRTKLANLFKSFFVTIKVYENRKLDLVLAIVLNFVGSLTSLVALWASAHSLGLDITLSQALVAYIFGNIMGGLVPTPGGIGAVEAGIYSGLVVIGLSAADAITVTLIYRLITYWVPIIPGYYFFWSLRKDVLKSFSLKRSEVSKIGV